MSIIVSSIMRLANSSGKMTQYWNVKYQLVPPNMHQCNAAYRAIRTFKAHSISIMAGIASNSPSHLGVILLLQSNITLNMID